MDMMTAWPVGTTIKPWTRQALSDVILYVTVGRLTELSWGRNAWQSTWVRRYNTNSVLFPVVTSAKASAERRRVQGTVFYLRQLPVLALHGQFTTVILADINARQPLQAWRPYTASASSDAVLAPLTPVSDAVGMFFRPDRWEGLPPSSDSLLAAVVDGGGWQGTPEPRSDSWSSASKSVGARRPLQWSATTSKVSDVGLFDVARTFNEQSSLTTMAAAYRKEGLPTPREAVQRATDIDEALRLMRVPSAAAASQIICSCTDEERSSSAHARTRLPLPRIVPDGPGGHRAVRCAFEYEAYLRVNRHRLDMLIEGRRQR